MRVKTGIQGFDPLIDGGIPQGHMVLVSGGEGTGKTTFALQYIVDGLMDHGEFGAFLTFSDDLEPLLKTGKNVGISLDVLADSKSVKFLTGSQDELKRFGGKTEMQVEDPVDSVQEVVEEVGAERLVLDGLISYKKLFNGGENFKTDFAKLRQELRDLECTSIVTSPIGFGVEGLVDGVVILHRVEENKEDRYLEVRKMRKTYHTNLVCQFEITDSGIVVNPPE